MIDTIKGFAHIKFDDYTSGILKNLAAEDSSNSQIDAAEG